MHYLQGSWHASAHFPLINLNGVLHSVQVPFEHALHPAGHCLHEVIVLLVPRTASNPLPQLRHVCKEVGSQTVQPAIHFKQVLVLVLYTKPGLQVSQTFVAPEVHAIQLSIHEAQTFDSKYAPILQLVQAAEPEPEQVKQLSWHLRQEAIELE